MHLSGLFVYPIKSCRGTSLEAAELGRRGITHDRECALVTADGRVVTQREQPRMALITPSWEAGQLVLAAPDMSPLRVTASDDGPRHEVHVWDDTCAGVDQGDLAAEWLSAFLGLPCRLMRMADDHMRPVDVEHLPGREVGFADAYPLLLISEESLADLNDRMDSPLPMERFRPNIVVSGASAYAEDGWDDIRIAGLELRVAKPCVRCTITTTDQRTAERGVEPLRTLAGYRRSPLGGVTFGQNVAHLGAGTLRVGDPVEVLA
jgi:uncharacterized protein